MLLDESSMEFDYIQDDNDSLTEGGDNDAKMARMDLEMTNDATFVNGSVPSILDGELFELLTRKPDSSITAKCMLCPLPRIKPGSIRSTGNFICHIKKCHPEMVERMKEKRRVKRSSPGILPQTIPRHEPRDVKACFAKPNAGRETNDTNDAQKEVEEALADFLVDTLLPPSIVHKESFKRFTSAIHRSNAASAYTPNSNTLEWIIHKRHQRVKEKIAEYLSSQQYLCSVAHVGTNGNKNFLGITVHYLERSNFERKSFSLALKTFNGQLSKRRIKEAIFDVHREYGILEKATTNIIDYDPNLVKAFRNYLDQSNSTEPEEQIEDLAGILKEDSVSSNIAHSYLRQSPHHNSSFHAPNFLSFQYSCGSYTLNFVASVDTHPSNLMDPDYIENHASAFSKAHSLWNHLKQNTSDVDSSDSFYTEHLVIPNPSDWTSLHKAVTSLLMHRAKVNQVCSANKLQKLSHSDYDFLQEWLMVMGPLAAALDVLSNDQMCFLGCVLPALHVLKKKMLILEGKLTYCEHLREVALKKIEERFAAVLDLSSETSRDYILASISHPRFRTSWIPQQNLESCKSIFFREFDKIQRNMSNSGGHKKPPAPTKSEEDFFSSLDEDSDQRDMEYENAVQMRALSYLANPRKELAVLHEFPVVMEMFLKYNTTLPSTAPSKRILRVVKPCARIGHNEHDSETLEKALLLNINSQKNMLK
ncbi:uncharacterized protein LOC124167499 [Ischnura elegans]|uniref:uncharacterized protein LOC124167499 n=1 Tax=Ischnura elegans TaxID=197161 RepID=UPI001ED87472|nr:uncharacterized protein LOC124167499 [Ischnura elegans]